MRRRTWFALSEVLLNNWPWPWKLAYWILMGIVLVVVALLPRIVQTILLGLILVLVILGTAGYFIFTAIYIRRTKA